jgi:hypothetical protein
MKQVCCDLAFPYQASRLSFLCRSTTAVTPSHRLFYFPLSLSNSFSHRFRWLRRLRDGRLAWGDGRLKAGRSCRSVWQLRGASQYLGHLLIPPAQLPHPPRATHHFPTGHSLSCDGCFYIMFHYTDMLAIY